MLIGVPGELISQRTTLTFHTLHKYEAITMVPLREREDSGLREQVIRCRRGKVEGSRAGCQKVVGNKIGACLLERRYSQGLGLQKQGEPSFWYKAVCSELGKPQADLELNHPAPCKWSLEFLEISKRTGLAVMSSPWNDELSLPGELMHSLRLGSVVQGDVSCPVTLRATDFKLGNPLPLDS